MKILWRVTVFTMVLACVLLVLQVLAGLWLDAALFPVFDTVVQHIVL